MKKYHWEKLVQEYRAGGYKTVKQFAKDKGYQDSAYFRQKMGRELISSSTESISRQPSPSPPPVKDGIRDPNRIQGIWDNLLCIIDQGSKGDLSTHEVYELARTLDHIQKAMEKPERLSEEEPMTKLIEAIDEAARKLT